MRNGLAAAVIAASILSMGISTAFAQDPAPRPEEPAAKESAPAAHEVEATVDFDAQMLPFKLRSLGRILICIVAAIAVVSLTVGMPGAPSLIFLIGLGFLTIDPIADLLIFHVLQSDQVKSQNWIYAILSLVGDAGGIGFMVVGVRRLGELWRRSQPGMM